ncbi:hypothetical protein [Sphingomonas koreensis]
MIDDANPALSASASTTTYQGIALDIALNNAQSGGRIAIALRGRDGARVAWSTGQEFSTFSGIRLSTVNRGAVPISTLSVDSETITFVIAPNDTGEGCRFTVQIFLAATPDIRQFTLVLMADAGSSVSAGLSMREPKPLSGSPTIFDWREY